MGIPPQARRLDRNRPDATPPAPGFFEASDATVRGAEDDNAFVQLQRNSDATNSLLHALIELGHDRREFVSTVRNPNAFVPGADDVGPMTMDAIDGDKLWSAVEAERKRDPRRFRDLPKTYVEYIHNAYNRNGGSQRDAETARRGGLPAQLFGGVVSSFMDPINVATLPFGGGAKTVGQKLLYGAITNMGVETAEQPVVANARHNRGEEYGVQDGLTDIASAGLFGAVAEGGLHGIGKVSAPVREAVMGRVIPMLPERWQPGMSIPDTHLADVAEAAIGRENMTPHERDAATVMRREAHIDATNPYVPDGAGTIAHREQLGAAMRRIYAEVPETAPQAAALPSGSPVPRLAGSTAISSGTVPVVAGETLKSHIRSVENASGDVNARPRFADGRLRSSALGPYQFTEPTWVSLYRRRYGKTGESDAAIAAKRTDPKLNEVLVDDLIADNRRMLERGGHAADAGNLYLAHFAGPDAVRLLDADPNVSARSVLGDAVIHANPFLEHMTAGDVVQWAHRKMGEAAPARGGAATGGDWRDDLNQQWDNLERERTELDAENVPPEGVRDVITASLDREAVPPPDLDVVATMPELRASRTAAPLPVRRRPSDVIEYLADRGGIRDDEGHNLRAGRGMGKTFVPRAGPLIRPKGMSLDYAGELLHESGFFTEPPTVADVLDMIDSAVNQGKKIYSHHDFADVHARERALREADDQGLREQLLNDHPWLDHKADAGLIDDVLARAAEGHDLGHALEDVVHERSRSLLDRAAHEAEDSTYAEDVPFDWQHDRPGARQAGAGGERPAAEQGAPRGGGATEPAARGAVEPEERTRQLEPFDDPHGKGADAQIESVEHDVKAALDPAIAERQRVAAALKAKSPLRPRADQESTIGAPLFDAADQFGFRLDAEGDVINPADLLAEFAEEDAALKAIKDCL